MTIDRLTVRDDTALTVAVPEPPGPLVLMRAAEEVTAPVPADDGVTVRVVVAVAPGATVRLGAAYPAGQPYGVPALSENDVAVQLSALSLFRTLTFSPTGDPGCVNTLPGAMDTVGVAVLHGAPG